MKKKTIVNLMLSLVVIGLAITATGCGENEFDASKVEPALRPILGYWRYTGSTYDSKSGYVFKSSGEVLHWSIDYSADDREYNELHAGTFGVDEEQHIYIVGDGKGVLADGKIYYITEISSDEITIFDPSGPEGLQYMKYRKLSMIPRP